MVSASGADAADVGVDCDVGGDAGAGADCGAVLVDVEAAPSGGRRGCCTRTGRWSTCESMPPRSLDRGVCY